MPGQKLPDIGEARRIDPRPLNDSLDAVERMRIEMGTTPIEFAAERLEDTRPELLQAMEWLDSTEHREYHVRLGEIVNQIDALRRELAERHGGS